MKKIKLLLMTMALFFTGIVSAQSTLGTLKGQIVDESNKTIPSAKVFIEGQGTTDRQLANLDGRFTFNGLKPGIYNIKAVSMGKDTTTINTVEVKPNANVDLDQIVLQESSIMKDPIIITYKPPLIKKDISKIEIDLSDIENSPNIQNPKELFASMNSDIIIQEGTSDMIIRGSRPGDVIYYVDGVKTSDLNGVPGVGIGSMMGYTGGVPAKYGDTTGGVVVLETKSYFDLYYAWLAGR
ncbi:MAG: putative iron transport outer membrane receptor [uncultured marine phage]|uniref:Putative iron transport outer membrane receptor n=1 Tax=uncultured marine phage TaxID=707152 RepID=A0A8D9FQE8_9VIRU|nr:MAG: putative iron transport outer membrane receptor [uncultured marine phage]